MAIMFMVYVSLSGITITWKRRW